MHWIAVLLLNASVAAAQLIAYESFSGMPTGGGVSGSGSDATGWAQSGWQGSTAPYHSIGNQAPNMTCQITNGALLNGGDRSLILSTAPEPTGGTNAATRALPPVNTTILMSLLIKPLVVGTGSDRFEIELRGGSKYLQFALVPSADQTRLTLDLKTHSFSSPSIAQLSPNATYLLVLRLARSSDSHTVSYWLNPNQLAQSQGSSVTVGGGLPASVAFDTLGLSVFSSDNGGPSALIAIDEIRVGYTWNDVVPQSTTQTVVPALSIAPAIAVNWQSKTNKTYQPQRSYDLTNWFDFGSAISGNGQQRSFLDSADQVPKSFYRVIER